MGYFDNVGTEDDPIYCVIGLESPKSDFKVYDKTITLEASSDNDVVAVATGAIGPTNNCPESPVNLGIVKIVTPPTPIADLQKDLSFSLFFYQNCGV